MVRRNRVIKLCKTLWYSVAIAIITLAVLLSIARAVTPMLSYYRPQLQQLASKVMHQPVKMGHVAASWYWFEPVLQFSDVMVLSDTDQHSIVKIQRLSVSIDIVDSLRHWRLSPGTIIASGASITVRQHQDGEITIDGVNRFQVSPNELSDSHHPRYFMEWLLTQDEITLRNINVHWVGRDGAVVPITRLNLSLINQGQYHQIRGRGQLAQTVPSRVNFVANFSGQPSDVEHWQGQLYLHGKDIIIGQWLQQASFAGITPSGGQVNLRLWMTWHKQHVTALQSQFMARHLNLKVAQKNQLFQRFSGHVAFARNEKGWQLSGDQLTLRVDGQTWPENSFLVQSLQDEQGRTQHQFYLDYLEAQPILSLLQQNPWLNKEIRTPLSKLNPRGIFQHILWQHILWQQKPEIDDWNLQADFYRVMLDKWKNIPSLKGFSGQLRIAPNMGFVHLDSNDVMLNLERVFPESWQLNELGGDIAWQHDEDGWWLTGDALEIKNDDLSFKTDFTWHRPDNAESKLGELNLLAGFSFEDTQHITHYLPSKLPDKDMSKKLVRWLKRAFSGTGSGVGTMVLRGNLTDFPFTYNEGMFLIDANINNMDMNYWPGWPRAQQLFGELSFRNRGMDATIYSGSLAGMPLKTLSAKIPYLGDDKEVLYLNEKLNTSSETVLQYIENSPLNKIIPNLEQVKISGPLTLNLNLALPFENLERNFSIGGSVVLNQAKLIIPEWQIVIDGIEGALNLAKDGLSATNIKADVLHTPTAISLQPLMKDKQRVANKVTLNGTMDINTLTKKIALPWTKKLKGKANYQASLIIPKQEKQALKLSIQSDLRGISSQLPAPFNKMTNEALPFTFQVEFVPQKTLKIMMHVADRASATFAFSQTKKGWQLQGGNLHLGAGKAQLPKQAEILVDGQLAHFVLVDWLPYWQQSNHALKPSFDGGSGYRIDLHLQKATIYGRDISNIGVQGKQGATGWSWHLVGPELVGDITIPKNWREGIKANLQRLRITSNKQSSPSVTLSPNRVPPLTLAIKQLRYDDMDFGNVQLVTHNTSNSVLIDKLILNSKAYQLKAKGLWFKQTENTTVSQLRGTLNTQPLAQALKEWGMTPPIDAKKGLLDFDFNWVGAPNEFALRNLNGTALLTLKNGSITHLDPETERKIGMGKLINILNLQSLPRRLMLDFGDITNKGFSFKSLQSHMKLQQGNAQLSGTYVDGSVAYIAITGSMNLASKQYNLLLKITPQMTSSLPVIIATAAGSPIAGVATFVASKIVNHAMQQSAKYAYKISGPWKNPVIKELQANKKITPRYRGRRG